MTEEKTFEPITSQEEFDERIKARLAREREKWAKESDTEDLKAQLEAKDEEISQIQREHYRADVRRALLDELAANGVAEEGRAQRVLRYINLDEVEPAEDGSPSAASVRHQLSDISRDLPELLDYQLGAGSRGSSKPVLKREDEQLSREQVEKMTEAEINSNWDKVKRFMAGERS